MFTHILLFLRFLIRIYFLSVLAKRETTQLILEHPAEFPVHGHLGSGLTSLRTVLDRIFFFSKEVFLFFQATVPALHLGVSCDSMCLEGSTPGAPAARFSHKSTFNAVLANREKNQSYHRCLEWTRERQLNQCLTHQGREKIKLPSMQGRKNWQGTENMEKLCKKIFFKNILPWQKVYTNFNLQTFLKS